MQVRTQGDGKHTRKFFFAGPLTWGEDAQRDTGSALAVKRNADRMEPAEADGSLVPVCNRGLHTNNTFGREKLAGVMGGYGGLGSCPAGATPPIS